MNSAHLQIAHSINKSNLEVMDWMENFINYVEKDNLKLYEKARKYADKLESENKKKEEEKIEYTCCGDEVKGIIEDIRICPTCKEHF